MSEFKERLAAMGDAWTTGKDAAIGIPAGMYKMQLQAAFIAESSNGNLMIKREHLILEGEHEGEVAYDQLMLETEQGPRWVSRWMGQMGFEAPSSPAEIAETVAAIEEAAPVYMGKVTKSEDFTNVRIQEVLETTADRPETAPERPAEGEEAGPSSDLEVGDTVTYPDDDGTEQTGEVTAFDGDDVHVQDATGDIWAISRSNLTKVMVETEDVEEDEELTGLIALAQATDIEVSDSDTKESVVAKLDEYSWEAEQLTPDEVELLKTAGISVTEPEPRAPAKKAVKKVSPAPAKKAKTKTAAKSVSRRKR